MKGLSKTKREDGSGRKKEKLYKKKNKKKRMIGKKERKKEDMEKGRKLKAERNRRKKKGKMNEGWMKQNIIKGQRTEDRKGEWRNTVREKKKETIEEVSKKNRKMGMNEWRVIVELN